MGDKHPTTEIDSSITLNIVDVPLNVCKFLFKQGFVYTKSTFNSLELENQIHERRFKHPDQGTPVYITLTSEFLDDNPRMVHLTISVHLHTNPTDEIDYLSNLAKKLITAYDNSH